MKKQVKEFDEYVSNNTDAVNDFLNEIGDRLVSINPLWNTILGRIIYVIVYESEF